MGSSVAAELHAIQDGLAIWRSTGECVLEITGDDRASWLQGMVTCEVQLLQDGESRYGCALDVKGRLVADFHIYRDDPEARLLLLVDTARAAPLLSHLEQLLVAEDVELAESTYHATSLQGPGAVTALGITDDSRDLHRLEINGTACLALARSHTGHPGYDIILPPEDVVHVASALMEKEAVEVEDTTIERFRVYAAIPKIGLDTQEKTLLLEAGLNDAVHWGKGCYLGQEVVRRQGDRGHTNRELRQVVFDTNHPVLRGTELWPLSDARKAAGTVWSSAIGPDGKQYALATVKRKHFQPGTMLEAKREGESMQCTITEKRIRSHAKRRDENDPDLVGRSAGAHRALL